MRKKLELSERCRQSDIRKTKQEIAEGILEDFPSAVEDDWTWKVVEVKREPEFDVTWIGTLEVDGDDGDD